MNKLEIDKNHMNLSSLLFACRTEVTVILPPPLLGPPFMSPCSKCLGYVLFLKSLDFPVNYCLEKKSLKPLCGLKPKCVPWHRNRCCLTKVVSDQIRFGSSRLNKFSPAFNISRYSYPNFNTSFLLFSKTKYMSQTL